MQDTTSKVLLAGVTRAVVAEFSRDDLYVAEPPAGVALGQAHLDVLRMLAEDRIDDPGAVTRLLEISRIVDAIQSGGEALAAPQEARGLLSDVFDRIVANVAFRPAPLSAEKRAAYDKALATLYADPALKLPTATYRDFALLRLDADKKDVVLLGLKAQLAAAQAEERTALEAQIAPLEETLWELRELVASTDEVYGFTAAKALVESVERSLDEFPPSVASNLEFLQQSRITDPVTNTTFLPASFLPGSLSEASWAPLRLTADDLRKAAGPDAAAVDEIESIELETQTLLVDRPWFWPALFENERWDWKNAAPPVSSGQPDPAGDTMVPAYVFALVFARYLLVKRRRTGGNQNPILLPAGNALLGRLLISAEGMRPATTLAPLTIGPAVVAPRSGVAQARLARRPGIAAHAAALEGLAPSAVMRSAAPAGAVSPALEATTVARPVHAMRAPMAAAELHALRPEVHTLRPEVLETIRLQREDIPIFHARFSASGVVVDENGQPVYGAELLLVGAEIERSTTTGSDGSFSFSNLAAGPLNVGIAREGFMSSEEVLLVPQRGGPATLQLGRLDPCEVTVQLVREDDGAPFEGRAQLTVTTPEGPRIEAIDDKSSAVLKLPVGRSTLVLTVAGAEAVTPRELVLDLQPGEDRTVRFEVRPAVALEMRDAQLLAVVCRRVPESPWKQT